MPVRYGEADRTLDAQFDRGYGLTYAQSSKVAPLPEEPSIAPERGDTDSLFQAAHPTAPWSVFVADKLAQVRVTGERQESPGGAVGVELRGPQLHLRWNGGGPGDVWIGGRPMDLRPAAARGDVVQIRLRVEEEPTRPVYVGLRCATSSQSAATGCGVAGGAMLELSEALKNASPDGWGTLSVPLACFTDKAADLSSVAAPFALATDGALRLALSEVRLVHAAVQGCTPLVVLK